MRSDRQMRLQFCPSDVRDFFLDLRSQPTYPLERVLEVRIYTTLTPNAHKRPNAKRTQRTYNQHSRLSTLVS